MVAILYQILYGPLFRVEALLDFGVRMRMNMQQCLNSNFEYIECGIFFTLIDELILMYWCLLLIYFNNMKQWLLEVML